MPPEFMYQTNVLSNAQLLAISMLGVASFTLLATLSHNSGLGSIKTTLILALVAVSFLGLGLFFFLC